MDLATVMGIGLSLVIVILVMILDGGSPLELLAHPSAILLTMVGSMVASIATMPFDGVVKIPKYIAKAFLSKKVNVPEIINTLATMADKARREGLLALEEESKKIPDPFLRQGIMLVVDGTDP
ncbi:MAG TPA: hypothetical protein VF338_03485, partial [Leptolinea sp.]